jgi:membrane protein DedA with SNARE-associated domain
MRLGSRFGARGLTRGAAMALAGANVVGCGVTYAFGRREGEERVV